MGIVMILIGGIAGAVRAWKKSFTSSWLLLFELTFALYVSVCLNPLLTSVLAIPGLAVGYRRAIALGGLFLIADLLIKKIICQIFPKDGSEPALPPFSRVLSAVSGFLAGMMIAAVLMYCFVHTPLFSNSSAKKGIHEASRRTLVGVVYAVNLFSFQSFPKDAVNKL